MLLASQGVSEPVSNRKEALQAAWEAYLGCPFWGEGEGSMWRARSGTGYEQSAEKALSLSCLPGGAPDAP